MLRVKKLSYKTILVKKSVVGTLVDPEGDVMVCSHPVVKSMLKAISLQEVKSVVPRKEVWNIESVIDWLKINPPNKSSIFEVSRHTVILLLLASGRRVHDLTLLSIAPDNFVLGKDSIIFWPIFGSKTDSASHRQSGWELKKTKQEVFNLVYWVDQLIQLSAKRRKAVIITVIIAGWLKTIFSASNIKATPGSVRSADASYNVEKNVDVDKILKRGNWSDPKNFFKYYCKFVEKPTARSKNFLFYSFNAL